MRTDSILCCVASMFYLAVVFFVFVLSHIIIRECYIPVSTPINLRIIFCL